MTPAQQKQYQAFRKIEQALMHDRDQLVSIRQTTFKKHPELMKQQQDYAHMIMTEMKRKGLSPQKELKDLRAMQDKLRSGKVKGKERKALLVKFQRQFLAFREAERKVLAMPKLQAAQKKLKDNVLAAMRKENPKTDSLLKDMDANRKKLVALRQSAAHKSK